VSNVDQKKIVETVDEYTVEFTIEGDSVVVQVLDARNGDSVTGYLHFTMDPAKLIEDEEQRKKLARVAVKILQIFRKYGNTIEAIIYEREAE
jgi:hypothetical protein